MSDPRSTGKVWDKIESGVVSVKYKKRNKWIEPKSMNKFKMLFFGKLTVPESE